MTKSNVPVHDNENNPESAEHLKQNRQHFSNQCLKVLEILNQGKRLTVANAIGYGIMSLPRRIGDIKEGGIKVEDEWVKDGNGKRLYKEWFLTITTRPTKKEVVQKAIKNHLPKTGKSKQKWVQPNLL